MGTHAASATLGSPSTHGIPTLAAHMETFEADLQEILISGEEIQRTISDLAARITVDGTRIKGDAISLVDDGQPHAVLVEVAR